MKEGSFFFLKDSYFEKFSDTNLKLNKKTENKHTQFRPYLYAFTDKDNPNIFWAIPMSSKTQKYRAIYQKCVQKYGRCDYLRFGRFAGRESTFVIQNMCPVTKKYISHPYNNKYGLPMDMNYTVKHEIIASAQRTLEKTKHGIKLIFPDIQSIYEQLEHELKEEQNFDFYEEPKKEKNLHAVKNPIETFCKQWAQEQDNIAQFEENAENAGEDVEW